MKLNDFFQFSGTRIFLNQTEFLNWLIDLTINWVQILTKSFSRKIFPCTKTIIRGERSFRYLSHENYHRKTSLRSNCFDEIFLDFTGWAQEFGRCEPGPCELIPGLVYDADTNQCAWPDEVGCSLDGKYFFQMFRYSFLFQ